MYLLCFPGRSLLPRDDSAGLLSLWSAGPCKDDGAEVIQGRESVRQSHGGEYRVPPSHGAVVADDGLEDIRRAQLRRQFPPPRGQGDGICRTVFSSVFFTSCRRARAQALFCFIFELRLLRNSRARDVALVLTRFMVVGLDSADWSEEKKAKKNFNVWIAGFHHDDWCFPING